MNRLSVWGKSEKIARKKSPRDFLKAFRLWERGAKRCKHAEKAARGLGMGRERRNSPLSSLPFILPIFSRSLTSTLLSGLSNGKFETARPGFPTSRLPRRKISRKRDFETHHKRFRDFEIRPKLSDPRFSKSRSIPLLSEHIEQRIS